MEQPVPSSLIAAKKIALDSSHLADIARDLFSRKAEHRARAKAVVQFLTDNGYVPVVSLHHTEELLKHQDDGVAQDGLRSLAHYPLVFVISGHKEPQAIPGSVLDLFAYEVSTVLSGDARDLEGIRQVVAGHLMSCHTGEEAYNRIVPFRQHIREFAIQGQELQRELASISHLDIGGIGDMKLRELRQSQYREPDEIHDGAQWLLNDLQQRLRNQGDKRLKAPQALAKEFTAQRYRDVQEFYARGGDPALIVLEHLGLDPSAVDEEMTIDDIGSLGVFLKQLQVACETLDIPPLGVKDVPPDLCPSWRIKSALCKARKSVGRASGSDLNDSFLASLCCYVDVITVDKRTAEYLSQVRRRDRELDALMGTVLKVSSYSQLPEALTT